MLMLPSQISLEELVEYTILMRAHINSFFFFFFCADYQRTRGEEIEKCEEKF